MKMKITDILTEGKFSKSMYAYHATKNEHLRSILKHGLIPNKSEDGYGSEDTSDAGYSLQALPGIYFTRRGRDARDIAKHIDGDGAIVIVCKIQPQDTEIDEDRFSGDIISEPKLTAAIRGDVQKMTNGNVEDYTDEMIDAFSRSYSQHVIVTQLSHLNRKLLLNIENDMYEYIKALTTFVTSESGGFVDESDIKKYQIILTKKLRSLSKKEPDRHHTFKITKPIAYSGSNRIVGFYAPFANNGRGKGWGDLGIFNNAVWHKENNPQNLIA